jgi:hypothetical protein
MDSALTPAQTAKLRLEVELRTSRSDTPKLYVYLKNTDGSWDNIRDGGLWYTTDTWYSWETTTSISDYLSSTGEVRIDVTGCPSSGNTNNWDMYFDAVRIIVTPN